MTINPTEYPCSQTGIHEHRQTGTKIRFGIYGEDKEVFNLARKLGHVFERAGQDALVEETRRIETEYPGIVIESKIIPAHP